MKKSTNKTIEEDLKKLLSENKIVIALSGSITCKNCQITRDNILKYMNHTKNNRLAFIYMDNTVDDMLESQYYQMNELDEYPKAAIFYGIIENVSFHEGIITEKELTSYNNSTRC